MVNEHEDLLTQEYQDDGKALPPLADTVFGEIFEDGALALFEMINGVLLDSGDKLISKIISVTIQKVNASATERTYRVDVLAVTEDNEIVIFEVQLGTMMVMNERSLIYGQRMLSSNAKRNCHGSRELSKV